MSNVDLQHIILKAQPATPASVAPFGYLLGPASDAPARALNFYGHAGVLRRAAEFISDEQTEMPLVTLNRRPLEVRWLERHFKHTQTFIPLGGCPFVVVVAPPNEEALPDLAKVVALHFDGSSAFVMRIGAWHEFPFALRDESHFIVVLRRETTESLKRENILANEACGPDIDKKDLQARAQVIFQIEL